MTVFDTATSLALRYLAPDQFVALRDQGIVGFQLTGDLFGAAT